ncbi:polygalacturonase inhibitor-like [Solanum tuberosum]|uniref:Polygalacturonase inhibiting protein n=1 Tax=Solanum tuberosum TaxID=4113 RepID=M1AFU6_SOLTU|nr:PREDICTED: polygalacturonase inhibitor-like [Solanum tuberosum]URN45581.1 PGIP [Solanum tuberosum]
MKPSSSSILSILSFSLLFLFQLSSSERCHPNDKKALLEFKKGLGNPEDLGNWDPKTDCCTDWYGPTIRCDEKTNRINVIDFTKMDMAGYLSPAIGDLTYLTTFSIHNVRNLTGPIPSTIVKLTNLEFFRISQTNISGPVPEVLSKLKSLTYINLSYNKLVGTIPPSLSQLPHLEFLGLDRNKLSGPIPESFRKLAPNLTYLYLGHNQLTGIVPTSFAGWSFATIDLSRNMLEGDISFLFGKDKTTFEMLLDRNKFEFDFSKLTFGKRLWRLDLNHNKIYGSIPKIIAKNPWQILNVSYNRLCGEIPKGEYMKKFEIYEYLHNKCLCGAPLPPCK